MFKLLVVFSTVLALAAAGSSGDVDDALLARVAEILSQNEASGGGGGADGADPALLARVSQIIAQSEASSGGSNGGYNSAPSSSYGAPSRSSSSSGGSGIQIGQPERAERISEFSISSGGGSRSGGSSGGYN